MTGTQRYWDGHAWTQHVAPASSSGDQATPPRGKEAVSSGLWTAAMLMMLFFPIGGFVAGCVILPKWPGGGVFIMVSSVISIFFWSGVLAS